MSQVFKNGARTELDNGISALTTQFTVIDGTIFPVANASVTGGVINQTSGDWFKLVLQDDEGNFEIVYCYGHENMTHTFTVIRGQEGTTARAYPVGTTVGLRLLSSDLNTIHSSLNALEETKQDKSSPAAKANALSVARQISLTGAVQANATWDASGALELVTNNIDVSKANGGTLVVARGGTGTTTSTGSGSVVLNTSPALSGIPTAPTASAATNTTQLATTAFVQTAVETRVASSEKGAANGVATLDATGKVPSTQLPSYVDDVLEFANLASFPATGETGKIYVALDTNKTYRWSGSAYVYITSGAVDSVAGKTGVVTLVKSDVGLGAVDNTSDMNKPVSAAVSAALVGKVDKVAGKQLSTEDYTTAEKTKLSGIAAGATANATDANLRDRSTHSGTQGVETITGLSAALDARVVETAATGAALLPSGTTAQRPDPTLHPSDLLVRGNTDTGKPEWYNRTKSAWQPFGDAGGELFSYAWHNGPRSSIDVGRVATDGQQLLLLTHPAVCQAIWDGKQNAVDESVWQSDPTKRNCWSRGDGTSWVRVPDLNAAVAGTGKPFYLRGGSSGLGGTSVGDAIRNITGAIKIGYNYGEQIHGGAGALYADTSGSISTNSGTTTGNTRAVFDASLVVPTADENRVKTAYGAWTVRVFTEVSNVGALDAGQLATQLGVVDAKVQALESKAPIAPGVAPQFSCRAWVNFNGTGTLSVRGSGNVLGVTDDGVGFYTINFGKPMPTANYAAIAVGENVIGSTRNGPAPINFHTYSTNSLRILTNDPAGNSLDYEVVNVAIFC